MGKPDPPPPPDPRVTAQAQTESNEATARLNAQLNRVNQYTPYGSVTYSNNGDTWSQTVNESPAQQRLRQLQEQQGTLLGRLGIDQTNRVSNILSTPYKSGRINLDKVMGGNFNARRYDPAARLGNFEDDVRARSFELATQGLEPQFQRSEEALRQRMADQGVNAGTDAFGSEMESFNTGKGNAYADAMLRADANAMGQRSQAAGELGQGFAQALSGRGQNLSEALQQYGLDNTADLADRQNPLNEIIALMNGVQTNPINPGSPYSTNVANTDVAGINNAAWNAQNQNYQTQMGGYNALWGGLAGLGGAALGGAKPWWV